MTSQTNKYNEINAAEHSLRELIEVKPDPADLKQSYNPFIINESISLPKLAEIQEVVQKSQNPSYTNAVLAFQEMKIVAGLLERTRKGFDGQPCRLINPQKIILTSQDKEKPHIGMELLIPNHRLYKVSDETEERFVMPSEQLELLIGSFFQKFYCDRNSCADDLFKKNVDFNCPYGLIGDKKALKYYNCHDMFNIASKVLDHMSPRKPYTEIINTLDRIYNTCKEHTEQ